MLAATACRSQAQKRFASAAAAYAPRSSSSDPSPSSSNASNAAPQSRPEAGPSKPSNLPPRSGWGTNRAKRFVETAREKVPPTGFDYTAKQRDAAYREKMAKNGLNEAKMYAQVRDRQRLLGVYPRMRDSRDGPSRNGNEATNSGRPEDRRQQRQPSFAGTSSSSQQQRQQPRQAPQQYQQRQQARRQPNARKPRELKKVDLPSGVVRLEHLVSLLQMRLSRTQRAARNIGLGDTAPDRLLNSEDASLIALELGFDPKINDETAFDLYPAPIVPELLEPRPPITGIFGHVDHGKTSLLDALRKTAVAAGEAGGITQHIGAFEVRLRDLSAVSSSLANSDATITFLDTPGHAAFTAMRSRGASVTDVVVLVVAADDGVKPQTEEVIGLIKSADVGVVVAISKCDKPGVDTARVKREILAAGLELEDFGGEIPAVEISSKTGQGLPELLETISALAEMRELKAERTGRAEGRVIESRVERGRGNVATVLVLRGCLRPQASVVAGTSWARIRTLVPSSGKPLSEAYPGQPVEVTGWKALPNAGDTVLEAQDEEQAKLVVSNRQQRLAQAKLWEDIEVLNDKRRLDDEAEAARRAEEESARNRGLRGNAVVAAGRAAADATLSQAAAGDGVKELNLVVKADVSGTVEAVVGAISGIGNKEARVKLVSSAVGGVQESDIELARTAQATIVAFNVKVPASVQKLANAPPAVPIITSPIIYRLVESVKSAVAALLPPIIEQRVHGEAIVQQIFEISLAGSSKKQVAGSRVQNGVFAKSRKARVVRNGKTVFVGTVETLKQVKKDVNEVAKGVECGISVDGFDEWQENDMIQSIEEVAVPRSL